jgi:hypothetical protein
MPGHYAHGQGINQDCAASGMHGWVHAARGVEVGPEVSCHCQAVWEQACIRHISQGGRGQAKLLLLQEKQQECIQVAHAAAIGAAMHI